MPFIFPSRALDIADAFDDRDVDDDAAAIDEVALFEVDFVGSPFFRQVDSAGFDISSAFRNENRMMEMKFYTTFQIYQIL